MLGSIIQDVLPHACGVHWRVGAHAATPSGACVTPFDRRPALIEAALVRMNSGLKMIIRFSTIVDMNPIFGIMALALETGMLAG